MALVHVCCRVGSAREQICTLYTGEYSVSLFPGPTQISVMLGEPECILYTGELNIFIKFVPLSGPCRPSLGSRRGSSSRRKPPKCPILLGPMVTQVTKVQLDKYLPGLVSIPDHGSGGWY